jgi:hypothetical protein
MYVAALKDHQATFRKSVRNAFDWCDYRVPVTMWLQQLRRCRRIDNFPPQKREMTNTSYFHPFILQSRTTETSKMRRLNLMSPIQAEKKKRRETDWMWRRPAAASKCWGLQTQMAIQWKKGWDYVRGCIEGSPSNVSTIGTKCLRLMWLPSASDYVTTATTAMSTDR